MKDGGLSVPIREHLEHVERTHLYERESVKGAAAPILPIALRENGSFSLFSKYCVKASIASYANYTNVGAVERI